VESSLLVFRFPVDLAVVTHAGDGCDERCELLADAVVFEVDRDREPPPGVGQ